MSIFSPSSLKILVVDTKNLRELEHDLADDHRLHELWYHIEHSGIPHTIYQTKSVSQVHVNNRMLELVACGMAFKDGWSMDEILIIAMCDNDAWIVDTSDAPK